MELFDKVKVVNSGVCYPNYTELAEVLNLENFNDANVYENILFSHDEEYTIVAIAKHPCAGEIIISGDNPIYHTENNILAIENWDGVQFLIDEAGCELINK